MFEKKNCPHSKYHAVYVKHIVYVSTPDGVYAYCEYEKVDRLIVAVGETAPLGDSQLSQVDKMSLAVRDKCSRLPVWKRWHDNLDRCLKRLLWRCYLSRTKRRRVACT